MLQLEGSVAYCSGAWTLANAAAVEASLGSVRWPSDGPVILDLSGLTALDTAGSWLLHRAVSKLERQGREVSIREPPAGASALLSRVRQVEPSACAPVEPERLGIVAEIGRALVEPARQTPEFLAFIGEAALAGVRGLLAPRHIRVRVALNNLQAAGLNALGIVGLLSFLVGVVIAYQSGVQLVRYGAGLYVADLVGLSMLRELSPLITAIIVAGRTGSAYTAQIGTMVLDEEVDALRAVGIDPMEMLVLPKLLAVVVALPLLTVFSDVVGLLGGMTMASAITGMGFGTFLDRLGQAVEPASFVIGVGKAPVFAVVIATVGCFHGLKVSQSAESVGRRTTMTVVQSIFLVIVVDAAFSVAFSTVGI